MRYKNKRFVLAGGADWSVEFLDLLKKEGFLIVGILAPPDAPKNRGQKLSTHPLKRAAEKLGVPVFQPPKLLDNDFLGKFRKLKPDIVVVTAYGKIFPEEILKIPKFGFINFHPSLLPKLRGPSPIASAILGGHKETGVSIMKLGKGMDDGPILAQEKIKISPGETTPTLTRKLVGLGKKMLPEALKKYIKAYGDEKKILLKEQEHSQATFSKILKKEDGKIDWQKETAKQIDRKIRALNPQFKTHSFFKKNDKQVRINIIETLGIGKGSIAPGKIEITDNKLAIGTKKGILLVSKLQVECKKPQECRDFFQGYREGYFV